MAWSLIKDTLEFAKRHLVILIMLILPVQVLLATLFEVSSIETVMVASMDQFNSQADKAPEPNVDQPPIDDEMDRKSLENQPNIEDSVPAPHYLSTGLLFGLYLILSVVPTALVILYVQAVFAAQSPNTSQLYAASLPLVIALLGFYTLVWGALFGFFILVFSVLSVLGGLGNEGTSFLITIYFGGCIYVHHRLSLAPYIWVNEPMPLRAALQKSWQEAKPVVFILLFGNCLLYVGALMLISMLVSVLHSLLPEQLAVVIRLFSSVVAGIGGVLMTIFVYRVYAFLQEPPASNNTVS